MPPSTTFDNNSAEMGVVFKNADQLFIGRQIFVSQVKAEACVANLSIASDTFQAHDLAAHFMARRTAGGIVRNAASLAGNSMLVLEHIYQGEPFPSDLFTALAAIDAEIVTCKVSTGAESRSTVAELVGRVVKDPELASDLVIIRYHIPYGSSTDIVQAQKVALPGKVRQIAVEHVGKEVGLVTDLGPTRFVFCDAAEARERVVFDDIGIVVLRLEAGFPGSEPATIGLHVRTPGESRLFEQIDDQALAERRRRPLVGGDVAQLAGEAGDVVRLRRMHDAVGAGDQYAFRGQRAQIRILQAVREILVLEHHHHDAIERSPDR